MIAILVMVTATQLGCISTSEKQGQTVEVETIRTDIDALSEIFPSLKGIESTEWEYELMTAKGRTPGPSDYCYRGIIVLDENSAEKYRNQYEWTEVSEQLLAQYMDLSQYEKKTWYVSNEMNKDLLSAGYIGNVYFCENYIWFDVITQ